MMYSVIDLETTGFSRNSEIIEVAVVQLNKHGSTHRVFSELIKPSGKIPDRITSVTGITNADLENARGVKEVLPQFIEILKGTTIIAHNGDNFDFEILHHACVLNGFYPQFHAMQDTLKILKRKYPQWEKHNMKYAVEKICPQLKALGSHRALSDALCLAEIYKKTVLYKA